jgi:hypothetical protein
MVGTALCETALQLSVRTVYRYGGTAVCETAVQLSLCTVYRYGGTAVCETAVQLSVCTVYRYGLDCRDLNSSETVGIYFIQIWWVLLCVKQQCNCRYVL